MCYVWKYRLVYVADSCSLNEMKISVRSVVIALLPANLSSCEDFNYSNFCVGSMDGCVHIFHGLLFK